jgi:hypothetical protein
MKDDVFERLLFNVLKAYGNYKIAMQEEDFDEEDVEELHSELVFLIARFPDALEGKKVFSRPETADLFNAELRRELMNSFINCIQTVDPNNNNVYEEMPGQPDSALGNDFFEKHDKGVLSDADQSQGH